MLPHMKTYIHKLLSIPDDCAHQSVARARCFFSSSALTLLPLQSNSPLTTVGPLHFLFLLNLPSTFLLAYYHLGFDHVTPQLEVLLSNLPHLTTLKIFSATSRGVPGAPWRPPLAPGCESWCAHCTSQRCAVRGLHELPCLYGL